MGITIGRTRRTPMLGNVMLLVKTQKVLLLGAGGMLGHRLWIDLRHRTDVTGTIRPNSPIASALGLAPNPAKLLELDANDAKATEALLTAVAPTQIINAIGYVKQRTDARSDVVNRTNAEFPLQLAAWCERNNSRLIHMSTDCVFSGNCGERSETDNPDPVDEYGRSKLAGEPGGDHSLVIRTSMIGRELSRFSGILEWCLRAPAPLSGWSHARFSGVSTVELSRVIVDLVDHRTGLHGLFHIAGPAIDKASLLREILVGFGRRPEVIDSLLPIIDRTLDSSKFASATGYVPPTWAAMITELASDSRYYDSLPVQFERTVSNAT